MDDILARIIDLLLLVGTVGLAFLAFKLGRRKAPQVPSDASATAKAREHMADDAKVRQDTVTEALTGKDPATALADLGDKRRS